MGRSKDFHLSIPRSVAETLALPESRKKRELQRERAGMGKQEFGRLLGERGVTRHYGAEELEEDLSYARDEEGHIPEEVPEA